MSKNRNFRFIDTHTVAFNKFSSFGTLEVTRLLTSHQAESAREVIATGDSILIDIFCYSLA